MYVITGATGNTGRPIVEALRTAGHPVRILSRDPEKARPLTDLGAELVVGHTGRQDVLERAFTGARAVYTMIPMEWTAEDYTAHQVGHAEALAAAIEKAGVPYVVALSSQGADLDRDSGVVLGLNRMEQRFREIHNAAILFLRPAYFMENTLGMIPLIRHQGIMGSPLKRDLQFAAIATRDVAAYAANRLLALDFSGHAVQDLLGPEDLSFEKIVVEYGQAIGKADLSYVEFPMDGFRETLIHKMGASPSVADNYCTFMEVMNQGRAMSGSGRTAQSSTPTTIGDFARDTFAPAFLSGTS